MPGESTHQSVVGLIETFLEKAAADEKSAGNLDLAGDAKSTHPSANVDDKTKPATEGARSSENEADVRKDVPDTINDEASKNTGGNEGATVNGDQGTVTMAADSGLKGNVDKPKKDHSDSMSDAGPGDGSDTFKGDWDKASAAKSLTGDANGLLADLTLLVKGASPDDKPAETPAGETPTQELPATGDGSGEGTKESNEQLVGLYKQAASQFPDDVEAGYAAAAMLAQHLGLIKDASAEGAGAKAVETIQKEAAVDAKNYADYLKGFANAKQAAGMDDPAALAALGNAGEGEAGTPAGGEMGGEAGGGDIGALLAGAGAGAGAGGEGGMPGAEGGMPGGEGGMPGGEGGEGGEEEIIAALAEALDEAGVTPEDLAQAVAEAEGGGEMGGEMGGMPGGEGGVEDMAPADAGGAPPVEKPASAKDSSVKALADVVAKRLKK